MTDAVARDQIGNPASAIPLRHPATAIWAATLLILMVDAAWILASDIALLPNGFLIVAGGVAVLVALGAFWTFVKDEAVLRGMALSTACLAAFTLAIAVLHYLLATLGRPLADPVLAEAERALGFDWAGYLAFLQQHPALGHALALAYHTSGPQVGVVVVALSAARDLPRLWTFCALFATTLLIVIAVSSAFPAEGPYAYYAPAGVDRSAIEAVGGVWHLEALEKLRSSSPQTVSLGEMRGLATFPSFHVCLALITAWALWPIPVLGGLGALLNMAVILGTVGAGGHYLPDVIAGGALGLAAIALGRRYLRHADTVCGARTPRSARIRSDVMRAPS